MEISQGAHSLSLTLDNGLLRIGAIRIGKGVDNDVALVDEFIAISPHDFGSVAVGPCETIGELIGGHLVSTHVGV